jgi:hypothetical protein
MDIEKDKPDKPPKKQAVRILITVGQIEDQQMALVMTVVQQVKLTMQPLDAKGNPAAIDGVAEWTVANPGVCSINPAPDGITAMCVALAVGDTQVSATGDADLGEGKREITGVIDISIKASEAVSIGIVAGTPEDQATPPGVNPLIHKAGKK